MKLFGPVKYSIRKLFNFFCGKISFDLTNSATKGSLPTVAFFVPNVGFLANFGELPNQLAERGCKVTWLIGDVDAFHNLNIKNKRLIINDEISYINEYDVIITATLMDCLPRDCISVLHDHISFSHFDTEEKVLNMRKKKNGFKRFSTKNEMLTEITPLVAFSLYYDMILTSSKPVDDLTKHTLNFLGYDEIKSDLFSSSVSNIYKGLPWRNFINKDRVKRSVHVLRSGYLKLETVQNRVSDVTAQKIIVYAPSPKESFGTKDNDIWQAALSSEAFGNQLLQAMCQNFPDYKIVYKPYKDELPEVVEAVVLGLHDFPNFAISDLGSDYWELYASSKLMISDFSSTAYSYALGLGRPVIFFSPNEDDIPRNVINSSFCKYRNSVGEVAKSVENAVSICDNMLKNYPAWLDKSTLFQSEFGASGKSSSSLAADGIIGLYNKYYNKG